MLPVHPLDVLQRLVVIDELGDVVEHLLQPDGLVVLGERTSAGEGALKFGFWVLSRPINSSEQAMA